MTTDTEKLIERCRKAVNDCNCPVDEAADALEAQAAEIERLRNEIWIAAQRGDLPKMVHERFTAALQHKEPTNE